MIAKYNLEMRGSNTPNSNRKSASLPPTSRNPYGGFLLDRVLQFGPKHLQIWFAETPLPKKALLRLHYDWVPMIWSRDHPKLRETVSDWSSRLEIVTDRRCFSRIVFWGSGGLYNLLHLINISDFNLSGGCFPFFLRIFLDFIQHLYDVW